MSLQGGGWRLLGVQLLACVLTATWGVLTTVIQLFVIERTIGIRLTRDEELKGCDRVEHGIGEEGGDEHDEENDGAPQTERASANHRHVSVRRRKLTDIEKFNNEGTEAPKEGKFAGASVMRCIWPPIARNLRRKFENTKCTKNETNTTHVDSLTQTQRNDKEPQKSHDSSQAHITSPMDVRKVNEDSRNSNDLRSIYSVESDIEELFRQEACYAMIAQKQTVDKCVQVVCEQGVLVEL